MDKSFRELDNKIFDFSLLSKYREVLMGIAIFCVLFHHLTYRVSGGVISNAYMFLRVTGAVGVDIFLFLSGIGLYYSLKNTPNIKTDILSFYKRRFIRIIPIFWIICTIPYLYVYIVERNNFTWFLLHITSLSFWFGSEEDWYISAIIVLYLLYPLIHYALQKNLLIYSLISYIIWCGITLSIFLLLPSFFNYINKFLARIPIFLFGAQIASAVKAHKKLPLEFVLIISIAINVLSLAVEAFYALKGADSAYSFFPRLFYFPLAVSFCVIVVFLLECFKFRRLKIVFGFLGKITLEIYLLNQKMIGLMVAFTSCFINGASGVIVGNILGIGISIILGYIIHVAFNKVKIIRT